MYIHKIEKHKNIKGLEYSIRATVFHDTRRNVRNNYSSNNRMLAFRCVALQQTCNIWLEIAPLRLGREVRCTVLNIRRRSVQKFFLWPHRLKCAHLCQIIRRSIHHGPTVWHKIWFALFESQRYSVDNSQTFERPHPRWQRLIDFVIEACLKLSSWRLKRFTW